MIDNVVQSQAQTLAYNNAFVLIGMAFAFFFPVVLLLQHPKPEAPLVAMH